MELRKFFRFFHFLLQNTFLPVECWHHVDEEKKNQQRKSILSQEFFQHFHRFFRLPETEQVS